MDNPGTMWVQVDFHLVIGGIETADENTGVYFPFHVSDLGMDKSLCTLTFGLLS